MLYTNKEGKARYKDGLRFWVWTEDDIYENDYLVSVNQEELILDDVGIYIINPESTVKFTEIVK